MSFHFGHAYNFMQKFSLFFLLFLTILDTSTHNSLFCAVKMNFFSMPICVGVNAAYFQRQHRRKRCTRTKTWFLLLVLPFLFFASFDMFGRWRNQWRIFRFFRAFQWLFFFKADEQRRHNTNICIGIFPPFSIPFARTYVPIASLSFRFIFTLKIDFYLQPQFRSKQNFRWRKWTEKKMKKNMKRSNTFS